MEYGVLTKREATEVKDMVEAVALHDDHNPEEIKKQMPKEFWEISKKRTVWWRELYAASASKDWEKAHVYAFMLNNHRDQIAKEPWFRKNKVHFLTY